MAVDSGRHVITLLLDVVGLVVVVSLHVVHCLWTTKPATIRRCRGKMLEAADTIANIVHLSPVNAPRLLLDTIWLSVSWTRFWVQV
jgi:hypothetical protein